MKSRFFKLATALLLICMFSLSLLTGCTTTKDGDPTGTDKPTTTTGKSTPTTTVTAAEEPARIKVFLRQRWGGVEFDSYTVDYIQEQTNTVWDIIIGTKLAEQLNILFASKDFPDIITFAGDDAFESRMADDGILLPLNDHLDKMPHLYEYRKAMWDQMKHPDGNVYAVNALVDEMGGVDLLLTYRKDWLDKFGFKVPTTIDEYIEVADAFSNRDPDGNNQKDTFAMGGHDNRYHNHIYAAYGVLPQWWMDDGGKLVCGTVHPNMKEALRTMRQLYVMEAIDPEFITDDWDQTKAKFCEGVFGAMGMSTNIFCTNNTGDYYAPFKESNPDGELIFADVPKGPGYREDVNYIGLSQRGWVRNGIYAGTKELDACLRVFDWMNTDEGKMAHFYGKEGEHYKWEEDGYVTRLVNDAGMKELGLTSVYIATTWLSLTDSKEAQEAAAFAKSRATYDAADGIMVEETALYSLDLEEYARNQFLRIILGDTPVDEGFDEMVSEWYKRGGQELTDAYNRIYQSRK